jgi:putative membrane protein
VRALRMAGDVGRGGLIGLVEIVPGVSGGTVALIIGVYERLIESAGHLARGLVALILDVLRGRGTARGAHELRAVHWGLVLPVMVGMVVTVVVAASVLAPVIEEHPVQTRAFFAGLILVSIAVPARMVGGRWRPREVLLAVLAAAVAFGLTGLSPVTVEEPSLWVVALAAAVAICALVMPGLSGSFILLALGLYAPTLNALNERDLAYIAVFGLGAVIGLGAFVEVLRWLLHHHRRVTLAVMTGIMAGSLRALWPWQGDDSSLQSPTGELGPVLAVFLLGIALVAGVLVADVLVQRTRRQARELPY